MYSTHIKAFNCPLSLNLNILATWNQMLGEYHGTHGSSSVTVETKFLRSEHHISGFETFHQYFF
jgi:hypothetical protein